MEDGAAVVDRLRRSAGLLLAPAVFAALWLAPLTLAPEAHKLAAVLAAVVVLWVSEAIPMAVTAFLGVAVAVVVGVAPAAEAFAPFSDPLVLSSVLAVLLSETTSNTASANMVVPVVIALARSAHIDPLLFAIGATMASSLGFVLPVSTPCNANVYGSGRIPLPTMMRHGIVLDLVGVVTIVAVVALLGPIVLGR